jgi:hypothetical protein
VLDRYERVLDACALRADLATFPSGDMTVVSGTSLSGGQRQRVSVARAAYSSAEVWAEWMPMDAHEVVSRWTGLIGCIAPLLPSADGAPRRPAKRAGLPRVGAGVWRMHAMCVFLCWPQGPRWH